MHRGRGGLFPAYSGATAGIRQQQLQQNDEKPQSAASSSFPNRPFTERSPQEMEASMRASLGAELQSRRLAEEKQRCAEKKQMEEDASLMGIRLTTSETFEDVENYSDSEEVTISCIQQPHRAEPSKDILVDSSDCVSVSSSSSESSRERRRRRKEKKRKKKEKKKRKKEEKKNRRKRKASHPSASDDEDHPRKRKTAEYANAAAQGSSTSLSILGDIHYTKNRWKLLKKDHYHENAIVLQPDGDRMCLESDESYKYEVPTYTRLPIVFASNMLLPLPFGNAPSTSKNLADPSRYFSKGFAPMPTDKIEKKFRSTVINQRDAEFIAISPFPFDGAEATPAAVLSQAGGIDWNSMDLERYKLLIASHDLAYESASAEGKQAILNNLVTNKDPKNVEAWLKLIRIQREIFAGLENKSASAPIDNKKALFDREEAIARRAIEANPRSVELQLERLTILQEFHGVNSEAVSKLRAQLLNQFNSSTKLWGHCIATRQNDRSAFTLSGTLNEMDRCMDTLQSFLRGEKVSHEVDPETEQFLVDLIVQRCQLLIESGNTHKAIAALQALAEFHLFRPALPSGQGNMAAKEKAMLAEFGKYWDSMAPKIGDVGAQGWKNAHLPAEERGSSTEISLSSVLSARLATKEADFKRQCHQYKCTGEVWKNYDQLAAAHEWWPLRFGESEGGIDGWREVHFHRIAEENDGGIAPVLFPLSRRELAEELVLRLLQLLGATIPGLEDKDPTQEKLMRQLQPDAFSFMPQYEELGSFLCRFICLLFHADAVNIPRLIAAYIQTCGKFHKTGTWKARMKALFGSFKSLVPTDKPIYSAVTSYFVMEMAGNEIAPEPEVQKVVKEVAKHMLANQKMSVWEMEAEMRLVYLRSYQLICEQALRCSGEGPTAVKGEGWVGLTAHQVLQRLILSGNVKEDSAISAIQARNRWERVLTGECLPDQLAGLKVKDTTDMRWFGSTPSTLLALAALFFYEESGHDEEIFDQAILSSPLGGRYGHEKSIYWLRIHLCEQHNQRISQASYRTLIWEAVEKFPTDPLLWKRHVDAEPSSFKLRIQLDTLGEQVTERPAALLARDCARIYVEWKDHLAAVDKDLSPNWGRIHAAVEKAVTNTCGSPFPDAYFWCLLFKVEASMGRGNKVEETFLQAQKRCPWSISLIREAVAIASLHNQKILMEADELAVRAELCTHRDMREAEVLF